MKLVIAPAIWLAHFNAIYLLLSLTCASGAARATAMGVEVVPLGVAVSTIVALASIAATAYRARVQSVSAADTSVAFTARVGVLLSLVCAIAVLWVAYPAFVLPACVI